MDAEAHAAFLHAQGMLYAEALRIAEQADITFGTDFNSSALRVAYVPKSARTKDCSASGPLCCTPKTFCIQNIVGFAGNIWNADELSCATFSTRSSNVLGPGGLWGIRDASLRTSWEPPEIEIGTKIGT
jgi:hypothetical protein